MSKPQSKEIKEMLDEIDEQNEVAEDLLTAKTQITTAALVVQLKKFNESIDELLSGFNDKAENEKEFAEKLKEYISGLMATLKEQKPPQIEFNPQIKMDLQPLQTLVSNFINQNNIFISLIEKLNSKPPDRSNEKLVILINTLIEKQTVFLEREIKQFDYSDQLKSISEGVNRNDRVQTLKVQRDQNTLLITEVIPIYKK